MPPSPTGPLNFTVPYVRVQTTFICKNCGVTVPKASVLGSSALEGRGSGSLAPHWRARWANEDELRQWWSQGGGMEFCSCCRNEVWSCLHLQHHIILGGCRFITVFSQIWKASTFDHIKETFSFSQYDLHFLF